jgi:hypothetical protein
MVRKARAASSMLSPGTKTTGGTGGARSEMPILGQQDPILSGAAPDEGAVGNPAFGNERVIPGRAQPPAEAAQHLIAQKPWHVFAR